MARRQEVVDAVFRVAVRDGLQHASLRKVADEAQLNIGPVRHYFAGHRELMLFAGERRNVAADLLEQLLPLDDARRTEVTVWLEFTTAARTDPGLFGWLRALSVGLPCFGIWLSWSVGPILLLVDLSGCGRARQVRLRLGALRDLTRSAAAWARAYEEDGQD